MIHSRFLPAIVPTIVVALFGCGGGGDKSRIDGAVDDLVDALNDADRAAAAKLFEPASIDPVNAAGDSSVVYRLLTIPGGSDFDADNVRTTVMDDRAQTEFDLTGKVERNDQHVGKMTLRIGLELRKAGGEWRFVSGSDRMLSTY
jgi:hypothetical protein